VDIVKKNPDGNGSTTLFDDDHVKQCLPPAARDHLLLRAGIIHEKPVVLPSDEILATMSERDIEDLITTYTGEPISVIEKRLRNCSDSGFLSFTQSLAKVISKDAQLLVSLGISREKIADCLDLLILLAKLNSLDNSLRFIHRYTEDIQEQQKEILEKQKECIKEKLEILKKKQRFQNQNRF